MSVATNWGAPTVKTSPCFNYFPIIYHYGRPQLSGSGAGQGILLVEGNLTVTGTGRLLRSGHRDRRL